MCQTSFFADSGALGGCLLVERPRRAEAAPVFSALPPAELESGTLLSTGR